MKPPQENRSQAQDLAHNKYSRKDSPFSWEIPPTTSRKSVTMLVRGTQGLSARLVGRGGTLRGHWGGCRATKNLLPSLHQAETL